MKAIDVTRVKRTKGGHEVRIYATDGGGRQPIHGAFMCDDGNWASATWDASGCFYSRNSKSEHDLVEEPETVEVERWINVYEGNTVIVFETRQEADEWLRPDRIACIHINRTVTKGEGLNGTE